MVGGFFVYAVQRFLQRSDAALLLAPNFVDRTNLNIIPDSSSDSTERRALRKSSEGGEWAMVA